MSHNNQNLLLGALFGGVVGAATLLLLTPVSGKKVRQKIVKSVSTLNGKEVVHETHHRPKKRPVKARAQAATATKRKKKVSRSNLGQA